MKALVVGYGAMGKLVADTLKDKLAAVVSIECEYKSIFDVKEDFDVIIDFSNPANLDMIYEYVNETKKPVVFATTGYNEEQIAKINKLASIAPVLRSANFSLGVILLNKLVKEITPILMDTFDIEIIEAHHHNKIDSPSGTAKMLLNSVIEQTNYKIKAGRDGYSPRDPHEVGVHSIRGGSIVGEHEVLFCGEDEVLSLKHSAQSKKIFAVGAIKAADWLCDKQPGLYSMEDVLF
ncbi:MAG: 4-hydroxy-tetrahydrodipicolinate reductase [Anaeroplasma sp.]